MPIDEIEQPFDSVESAYNFMNVLADTILEAMKEVSEEKQVALREGQLRRAQAIELALFKLKMLTCYVHKSRRTLNDLLLIRRLILTETVDTRARDSPDGSFELTEIL